MSSIQFSHAVVPIQPSRNSSRDLADTTMQGVLRRRGIALRCRTADLARALQQFRDRQAEINAGLTGASLDAAIAMPPVAAGWLPERLAA